MEDIEQDGENPVHVGAQRLESLLQSEGLCSFEIKQFDRGKEEGPWKTAGTQ